MRRCSTNVEVWTEFLYAGALYSNQMTLLDVQDCIHQSIDCACNSRLKPGCSAALIFLSRFSSSSDSWNSWNSCWRVFFFRELWTPNCKNSNRTRTDWRLRGNCDLRWWNPQLITMELLNWKYRPKTNKEIRTNQKSKIFWTSIIVDMRTTLIIRASSTNLVKIFISWNK